jgi:hypothetical protein
MFKFSFTMADLVRSAWVFATAFGITLLGTQELSKAALWAAGAAGLIALKNFVLSDGSTLKG